MAKSGKSQFAVLGMLALLKKCSGYDLKKHMESSTQYFWRETFSSIYPILEDLEKKQLIKKIDVPTKSDRKRNLYALTRAGENVLEQWLAQTPDEIQVRNELLLKLFFGSLVPREINIKHLQDYKITITKKISAFEQIEHTLRNSNDPDSLYSLIAVDHGIKHALASLQWCDQAIKTLKSSKKDSHKPGKK